MSAQRSVDSVPDGEPEPCPEEPATEAPAEHDPVEICRCIALCFSAGELGRFAQELGVPADPGARLEEAAHALVRAIQGRGELGNLVELLQERKPLVQWPSPRPCAQPPPQPEPLPTAPPQPLPAPPSSEPGPAAPPPLLDPYVSGRFEEAATTDAAAPPGGVPARTPRRAAPAMALATLAAAAVMAAVAVGFHLGRGSTGAGAAAENAARPASMASAELARAVASMAEACGVDPTGSPPRSALLLAFRRCRQARPGAYTNDLAAGAGPALPGLGLSGGPSLPAAPGPIERRRSATEPPACLRGCEQRHALCRANECGPEPGLASQFPAYQRCLSACLSEASRCRLACR
ncbi:MAG: hypothetical protein HY744_07755 [Deltaproteobacteria bacterium]|nr:hypothetical protein [Deltaproteobacteria bacterium]